MSSKSQVLQRKLEHVCTYANYHSQEPLWHEIRTFVREQGENMLSCGVFVANDDMRVVTVVGGQLVAVRRYDSVKELREFVEQLCRLVENSK